MEVVSIPVIVAIVYAIIEGYKLIFKSETAKNIIPIVAGVLGAVLGVVAFFVVPTIVPADNVFVSAFYGLVSGLVSVGGNQVVKQLQKLFKGEQIGD